MATKFNLEKVVTKKRVVCNRCGASVQITEDGAEKYAAALHFASWHDLFECDHPQLTPKQEPTDE